jgi:lysophospholipid acyltransferase (LPLAT)-like uncharacterized protein
MKLRSPWLIRIAALLLAILVRFWIGSIRGRAYDPEGVAPPPLSGDRRFIYAFWHEYLLLPLNRFGQGNVRILISKSADGDLIAQVAGHLLFSVVRGSPKAGSVAALRELQKVAKRGHLAFTPDGPLGPRRKVKIGMIWTASVTGLPIVPVGLAGASGVRAKSWDRFFLPWPNSAAAAVAGPAIHVPPDLSREQLEEYRQRVEDAMNLATAQAEAWLATGELPLELDPLQPPEDRPLPTQKAA